MTKTPRNALNDSRPENLIMRGRTIVRNSRLGYGVRSKETARTPPLTVPVECGGKVWEPNPNAKPEGIAELKTRFPT